MFDETNNDREEMWWLEGGKEEYTSIKHWLLLGYMYIASGPFLKFYDNFCVRMWFFPYENISGYRQK